MNVCPGAHKLCGMWGCSPSKMSKKLDSLRLLSKPCLGQVLLDIFLQSYLYPTASEATWAISYILKLTEMSISQNNFLKLSTQKRDV